MEFSSTKGAIVLVAYNRPDELQRVLSSIKSSKREIINELVISLHLGNRDVEALCYEIDWIRTRILEKRHDSSSTKKKINQNVFAGIKGAFENPANDWAVVIEDDIVVSEDFFFFVSEMMKRFSKDKNFFGINGFSGVPRKNSKSSEFGRYRYGFGWGWALSREKWISLNRYWSGQEDFHWDQLIEPVVKSGYVIMPLQSRIKNIGFNEKASHTYRKGQDFYVQEQKLLDSFVETTSNGLYEERSIDLNWRHDCRVYLNFPRWQALIVSGIYKIKKICRTKPQDSALIPFLKSIANRVLDLIVNSIYVYRDLKGRRR